MSAFGAFLALPFRVPSRGRGLYEVLITDHLLTELGDLEGGLTANIEDVHAAEVPDRLALHVSRWLAHELESVPSKERPAVGAAVARRLMEVVAAQLRRGAPEGEQPVSPARLLRSIAKRRPDGEAESIATPLTPLLDTTLLTNAPGEPRVGRQVNAEIESADRIDVVMAFIRRSGLRDLVANLRRHCDAGRPLRVLTTTYTQSTEVEALEQLAELGAEVRVSYDTTGTRLHAKAWLFHRESGFSTALIGSSNLTHSAQVSGLEWNVRASGARNPAVVEKVAAVFDSYWHSGDFVDFDRSDFVAQVRASSDRGPRVYLSPAELRAEPFQARMLELLALARAQGRHRNLIVSATGTGKTVMAALDYCRLRAQLKRSRLLFVAHRREILEQSLATFRHALRDPAFGELWVDRYRPQDFEHVFASVQSLHAADLANLAPDHFDVVIVDEFHHAAARSYEALLEHILPVELLGLTATPERTDGLDVLSHFGGRIAAELRLWDAIDQHRLCPFAYFGIHDGLDLRDIPWRRGTGYDVDGLSALITANDFWARQVIQSLIRHVDDVGSIRALGFCVSIEHARYMARVFNAHGIKSTAIWGETSHSDRDAALASLRAGDTRVVFSVDLFNEGVDLPNVDTLLLLRPTESATLFLQQLGRGLRRAEGKAFCTVLDFVGTHRAEFRFDHRFRALLRVSRRELQSQVEQGFPFLPAGCHMQLDRKAQEVVLESLRRSVPSDWRSRVMELRSMAESGAPPSMRAFLGETGLDVEDLYSSDRGWSDLCSAAEVQLKPEGPHEQSLRRGIGRLLHVDDAARIAAYRSLLEASRYPDWGALSTIERRYARMLAAQLGDQVFVKGARPEDAWPMLWQHPQVRAEASELLDLLHDRIDHQTWPLATRPEVPLAVHARYTRIEILAAFGDGASAKVAAWQTGVRYLKDHRADLLAFTLDKTSGAFSPTTRYRDYAISRELIHWESQGITRADSDTGLRYQRHVATNSAVLLFARLRDSDRAFWFLGPATYVEHRGEKPMAITWRLEYPLPGDLFSQFAAAVA